MKADLSTQIHDLMDRGLRPVTMADIRHHAPVRVTRLRRTVATSRSRPGQGRRILAGALTAAACAVLALAIVLTAATVNGTGTARLAAWSVWKQPDGSVMVTLRELPDPARLQRKLRADGIPARVAAERARQTSPHTYLMPDVSIPGCNISQRGDRGLPPSLWQQIFYGPHTRVRSYTFWVYPAAIPAGRAVVIFVEVGPGKLSSSNQRPGTALGYGVDGYSLALADASVQCTGS